MDALPPISRRWAIIFCMACLVGLLACTATHEWLVRRAGREPMLVDDEALWATIRREVPQLSGNDILLLGASRMQTDLNEATLQEMLPDRRVLNLAISGKGSSFPVLQDIVDRTSFAGILIIDETLPSLEAGNDQQSFVDYSRRDFTFDRRVNRAIETWLQERFVCLGFGQSSIRLLLSLLSRGRLPDAAYTVTDARRFTQSFFSRLRPEFLAEIRRERLAGQVAPTGAGNSVATTVERWKALLESFRSRGGRAIFVCMPVGNERWKLNNSNGLAESQWNQIMGALQVPAINCNTSADAFPSFDTPDASHLDASDTDRFTRELVARLTPFF